MKAMFCDMYNFTNTGDISANLNAASCDMVCMGFDVYNMQGNEKVFKTLNSIATDSDHIPVVCLNFQGSKSNNVCTEDGTCYSMNAMHGHDVHVVCFEPGIAKREGSNSRFVNDTSVTLRAQMGDNQPAVCYSMSQRQISMMVGENQTASLVSTDYKDPQLVCYEITDEQCELKEQICYSNQAYGISRRLLKGGENGGGLPLGSDIQPSITANGCGAVCYEDKK